MTAPKNAPVSDEDLEAFRAYYRDNPAWGSLHIVLDDQNIEDEHVLWCINHARATGDIEGERLARIVLGLSWSQRLNLENRVERRPRSRHSRLLKPQTRVIRDDPAFDAEMENKVRMFYANLFPKTIVFSYHIKVVGWYQPSYGIPPTARGETLH